MNESWNTYLTSPKPGFPYLQNGVIKSSSQSYSEDELLWKALSLASSKYPLSFSYYYL